MQSTRKSFFVFPLLGAPLKQKDLNSSGVNSVKKRRKARKGIKSSWKILNEWNTMLVFWQPRHKNSKQLRYCNVVLLLL